MHIDPIRGLRVLGSASAFPRDVSTDALALDNAGVLAALAALGDDDRDSWLRRAERWGVRERQWLELPGGPPSERDVLDLAAAAARGALDQAGVAVREVDLWLVATSTPSRITSSVAARLAVRLGSDALAIELRGGGAGALHGVVLAATCGARRAVVVAAEVLSALLDPTDLASALLYADGAAALVLGRDPGWEGGLQGAHLGTAAVAGRPFTVPGRLPPTPEALATGAYRFQPPDRAYQDALQGVWDKAADSLRPLIAPGAWLAPYPVTRPTAERAATRLGLPWSDVAFPLADHGCIGSAGVLAAWHAARTADPARAVGALAVGGGVTWAAVAFGP